MRSRSFPIRDGCRRSPPRSSTPSPPRELTALGANLSKNPVRPSSTYCVGLAAGLSRREIGAELYISLNTVKSHTRELYRKLGATSQAEAVARAEALGLLDSSQSPG